MRSTLLKRIWLASSVGIAVCLISVFAVLAGPLPKLAVVRPLATPVQTVAPLPTGKVLAVEAGTVIPAETAAPKPSGSSRVDQPIATSYPVPSAPPVPAPLPSVDPSPIPTISPAPTPIGGGCGGCGPVSKGIVCPMYCTN